MVNFRAVDVRGRVKVALVLATLVLTVFLSALSLPPSRAYARAYDMTQTAIDATVNPDGSIDVVETRTFSFDGSFNGVFWKIPHGKNPTTEKVVDIQVKSAGIVSPDGEFTPFADSQQSAAGSGSYVVADEGSYYKVTLFSPQEDRSVKFRISYRATNVAARWSDTSELYWTFVSDGWDQSSRDVTCAIHLPVPQGQSVRGGDNVRAWGHGPIDGTISFSGSEVVYRVPEVGADEFAAARIAFPSAWLSEAPVSGGDMLPTILSEEEKEAAKANARRMAARAFVWTLTGGAVSLALVALVLTALTSRAYRRVRMGGFDGKYFRDVPTADHPAVLGFLENNEANEGRFLTSAIMRLADEGVVTLEKVEVYKSGRSGRTRGDYRVTLLGKPERPGKDASAAARSASKIDFEAIHFLFERVAAQSPAVVEVGDTNGFVEAPAGDRGSRLYLSSIELYAKGSPEEYREAFSEWEYAVSNECARRFDRAREPRGSFKTAAFVLALLSLVGGVIYGLVGIAQGFGIALLLGVAAFAIGTGIACFCLLRRLRNYNDEGIDARAKLVGLKRWLKDFTRLEEAIPQDVVLWNRLLVMAVALGVADEVIAQIRVAMPQLLEDPDFIPVYSWYYYGHGRSGASPAQAFDSAVTKAHTVSTAALAGTAFTSSSGGGGGFSGGGGGFGGGGGGGAF